MSKQFYPGSDLKKWNQTANAFQAEYGIKDKKSSYTTDGIP